MDAWSATIRDHTNSNAPAADGVVGLVVGAGGGDHPVHVRNWPNSGRFGTMLRDVYRPRVINGAATANGNWELTMMEATLRIAVFLEDRAANDRAVAKYRTRVPAFVYLASDGALPRTPPGSGIDTRDEIIGHWHGQTTFVDGPSQETCRDFTHTGYGIASIYERTGPPAWLCGGTVHRGLGPVTEVGFNALAFRLSIPMTNTQWYTESRRPQGTNNLFVSWQTLTHAQNPACRSTRRRPLSPGGGRRAHPNHRQLFLS